MTCGEVADCADACGDDEICVGGCVAQGTTAAQAEYAEVVSCYVETPVQSAIDIAENCADVLAACVANDSGEDSCGDVLDCQDNCGENDDACDQACFDAGTMGAQEDYIGLVYCWLEECPTLMPLCVLGTMDEGELCEDFAIDCFGGLP